MSSHAFGDPLSRPFWDAARDQRLALQRCTRCGRHQFYPRPFCVACDAPVEWVTASGRGTVYSRTIVRMPVRPDLEPPYAVGIIQLEEGPRIVATLGELDIAIGESVTIRWRPRPDAPPVPVFGRPDADRGSSSGTKGA